MVSKAYFNPITEEIEEQVWEQLDKTRKGVKKDIEAIKLWFDTQPHLPQIMNDHQMQSFLLIGRGYVEKTKPKIDMYFTMRSLFPDIFENSHPLSDRMVQVRKYLYIVPVPKLSYDFSRILIFKLKETEDIDPLACFADIINVVDIRLLEDFCSGHTILFDLQHCKLHHITKVTPSFIRIIYNITQKALTTRVHGIHVINAPKFLDQVVLLVKSIVSTKVGNKIYLHKDMKSVIDTIDKDILPRDYGGNEKSLEELQNEFGKKFNEYKNFFDLRETVKVDESLRPSKNINDDILGYHGSFKKLDVD